LRSRKNVSSAKKQAKRVRNDMCTLISLTFQFQYRVHFTKVYAINAIENTATRTNMNICLFDLLEISVKTLSSTVEDCCDKIKSSTLFTYYA